MIGMDAPPRSEARPEVVGFVSYSHKDEELKNALVEHMALMMRQHTISLLWHDRMITPGDEWKGQIDTNLGAANLVLLLVSSAFMASDYCYDVEMKEALRRHREEGIAIIPILLRPTDLKGAPFAKFQMLPTGQRPVTAWSNRDDAFDDIVKGIRRRIEGDPGCIVEGERSENVRGSETTVTPPIPATVSRAWSAAMPLGAAVLLTLIMLVIFVRQAPPRALEVVVVFAIASALCFGVWAALRSKRRNR
jgi:hypothetical protein